MAIILIVDDRAINREFLVTLLGYGAHQLLEAADGKEALKIIKEAHPDLIITDILMPTMSGYELAQKLQTDPDLAKIPVIFYTATYRMEEARSLAQSCGVKYVLTKPSDPEVIMDVVNQALGIPTAAAQRTYTIPNKQLNNILERPPIVNRISNHLSDMEAIQKTFNELIEQTQALGVKNENLIEISEKFSQRLNHLRKMTSRLVTLVEFNVDLISERDPSKLLKLFCDGARKIMGAKYLTLGVLNNENEDFKYSFFSGIDQAVEDNISILQTNSSIIRQILKTRDVIKIDNIQESSKIDLPANHPKVNCLLGIPIITTCHLYGFLCFLDKVDNSLFSEVDVQIATTLAAEIAVFYENIELYNIIQRHAASLEIEKFERKNIQTELQASELRYHSVMERATCGIFIMDQNGIISDINKQTEKIFGSVRDNIIGKNFMNFIPVTERDYADIQFQKLLVEKTIGPNQGHIQQPNGNIVDFEFTSVYVENEREKFLFTILNDITENNRLRAQTILADKLATVGTLAAGIIHEINNPMTFVYSNLEYINKKIKTIILDDTQHRDFILNLKDVIDESLQGARKIIKIIHDLKGFARKDQDELTLVNINEVLNTAINIAHPQFKNHAQLKTDFATDLPLLLSSNGKLNQVFLNLIINAAQAMDGDDFQKNIIHIKTFAEQDGICIDITDTGKGITPNILSKIFDPFFTTKPAGVGTGLGLSICSEIINGLGGQIIAKSNLGKGSMFSIFLPINLIEETTTSMSAPIKNVTGKKILIIDDQPTVLKTLDRVLGKNNQVTQALGGRAAFDLLISGGQQFDIIVSELEMPDISGVDLYRYLAKYKPSLAKIMIFTIAGPRNFLTTEFLLSIKNPCIKKPFTKNLLLEAIDGVLEKGK
jgi:PAS domain S-box-containing protein